MSDSNREASVPSQPSAEEPLHESGLARGLDALEEFETRRSSLGHEAVKAAGVSGSPLTGHDLDRRQEIMEAYVGVPPERVRARRTRAAVLLKAIHRARKAQSEGPIGDEYS